MLSICLMLLHQMAATWFPVSLALALLLLHPQWHRVGGDPLSLSTLTFVSFVPLVIGHAGGGGDCCAEDVSQRGTRPL